MESEYCRHCYDDNCNMNVGVHHSLRYASQSFLNERMLQVGNITEFDLAGKFHLDFPHVHRWGLPHSHASQYQL